MMVYINDDSGYHTLLVVSPIKFLLEDQVKKLGDLGINAIALCDINEALPSIISNFMSGKVSNY